MLRTVSVTWKSHSVVTIIIIKAGPDIQPPLNYQTEYSYLAIYYWVTNHPETQCFKIMNILLYLPYILQVGNLSRTQVGDSLALQCQPLSGVQFSDGLIQRVQMAGLMFSTLEQKTGRQHSAETVTCRASMSQGLFSMVVTG